MKNYPITTALVESQIARFEELKAAESVSWFGRSQNYLQSLQHVIAMREKQGNPFMVQDFKLKTLITETQKLCASADSLEKDVGHKLLVFLQSIPGYVLLKPLHWVTDNQYLHVLAQMKVIFPEGTDFQELRSTKEVIALKP